MPRLTYVLTLLIPLWAGCSGGGGGNSGDAQGPPPPPFSVVRETGLAVANQFGDVAVVGRVALVPVSEPESGTDLNGDGDTNDMVLHRLDVDTLETVNLGIALRGPVLASDERFAFLASEHDEGKDLNFDGDAEDGIWHVYDPNRIVSSTNPRNLQLATPASGRPGVGTTGGFVLVVSELAQGADFNGDQDLGDDVLLAFVDASEALLPIGGPPYAFGTPLVAGGSRVLYTGTEFGAVIDYSGDGDASDFVLGAVFFDGVGLAVYQPVGPLRPRAIVRGAYGMAGSMAVYLIDEAATGATDLNGDGDANDGIIALYDFENGQGEILPNDPALGPLPLAGSAIYGFATTDERIIVGIDEAGQGRDFNVDQDMADVILAWIHTTAAPRRLNVLGLTLGTAKPVADGELGLVTVSEAASALVVGIDYNNDGDIGDEVAFAVNMSTIPGSTMNLGLAAGSVSLRGIDAVIGVIESGQSGTDFNGDSDIFDIVPFYADLSRPTPSFRSLGTAAHEHVLLRSPSEVRLGLLIPEQPLTTRADVNGDGDSDDNALIWIDLDSTTTPPRVLTPTPQLAGIGSFSLSPPVVVDVDTLLFATSERMAGLDLNNDGDTEDTLLRIAFRPPPPE